MILKIKAVKRYNAVTAIMLYKCCDICKYATTNQ